MSNNCAKRLSESVKKRSKVSDRRNDMFDGLWVIEFKTSISFGGGVLVFNGSKVMGGDFGYYYFGEIDTTEGMTGEINVIRFNQNAISVFGDIGSFTLLIKSGEINETSFKANAIIKGADHLSIEIIGEKKVDIDETI